MTKVKVIHPFVDDKGSYGVGETISLDDAKAFALAKSGSVEFVTKKAFNIMLDKEEESKQQELDEEKKLAAIVHKEELENERTKLQLRVDDITNTLDDGIAYYETYTSLLDDLKKKEK